MITSPEDSKEMYEKNIRINEIIKSFCHRMKGIEKTLHLDIHDGVWLEWDHLEENLYFCTSHSKTAWFAMSFDSKMYAANFLPLFNIYL